MLAQTQQVDGQPVAQAVEEIKDHVEKVKGIVETVKGDVAKVMVDSSIAKQHAEQAMDELQGDIHKITSGLATMGLVKGSQAATSVDQFQGELLTIKADVGTIRQAVETIRESLRAPRRSLSTGQQTHPSSPNGIVRRTTSSSTLQLPEVQHQPR